MFRRNTLIESENSKNKIVVSTVGNMVDELTNSGSDISGVIEIGAGRIAETSAFIAKKDGEYWDADVKKEINVNGKWCITTHEKHDDNDINNMHDNIVEQMGNRLLVGEFENM